MISESPLTETSKILILSLSLTGVCISFERICQHESITTRKDAGTKMLSCVIKIKVRPSLKMNVIQAERKELVKGPLVPSSYAPGSGPLSFGIKDHCLTV